MKKISFILSLILLSHVSDSQVVKNVVVEHFTNTKCGICANKNPGFYNNLWNHPDILHITFHPSAPYSECYLNKLNPDENDDRTKYYNLYGGTPRFAIQGENVASSTNINNPSLFTPYTGKSSEASIKISHEKFGSDSIRVRVTVITESSNSYGNLKLFVALVEDTLAYTGSNGEDKHYDVFRKALSDIEGNNLSLAGVLDSVVFTYSQAFDPIWNYKRIYALAILQEESNKKVVQTDATASDPAGSPLGIAEQNDLKLEIYPNPVNDILTINSSEEILTVDLIDIQGKKHYSKQQVKAQGLKLNVSSIKPGLYFLSIRSKNGLVNKKVVVE